MGLLQPCCYQVLILMDTVVLTNPFKLQLNAVTLNSSMPLLANKTSAGVATTKCEFQMLSKNLHGLAEY